MYIQQLWCGLAGGHIYERFRRAKQGTIPMPNDLLVCLRCGKEKRYGHRQSGENREGGTGAIPTTANSTAGTFTGITTTSAIGSAAGPCVAPEAPAVQAEEVEGWRSWLLYSAPTGFGHHKVWLGSLTRFLTWPGPTFVADAVPTKENANGVYARSASWNPSMFMAAMYVGPPHRVHGRVALSGIVLIGTDGYRAERATIQELWVPAVLEDVAPLLVYDALERRYQCPVHAGLAPIPNAVYL